MKSTIGEFEEIVLLVAAAQYNQAYGLSIANTIEEKLQRNVTLSSVHTALYRLEEKGFVRSEIGGSSRERGGRSKRIFMITKAGKNVIEETRNSRTMLWNMIPKISFEGI